MKQYKQWLFLAGLTGLCLAPTQGLLCRGAHAAFDRALADLQNSPDDLDLREHVIRLSQELATLPPTPEDVAVLEGKAVYAAKNASSPDDYRVAVDAYKKASLLAPWDGTLYYNQAGMEQQAGEPGDAIREYKLYLLATPEATDREQVLTRIGKLELQAEKKTQSDKDAAAQARLDAINAKAKAQWDQQENTGEVIMVSGIVAVCAGAAVGAWGVGTASGAGYTVAPGYNGGVDYNIPYDGKYWSTASYNAYTSGVEYEEVGGVVLVVGAVAWIAGAVMKPGPFQPQTALLNLQDDKLALGVPPMTLLPHGQGMRATLLSAQF